MAPKWPKPDVRRMIFASMEDLPHTLASWISTDPNTDAGEILRHTINALAKLGQVWPALQDTRDSGAYCSPHCHHEPRERQDQGFALSVYAQWKADIASFKLYLGQLCIMQFGGALY
jgi:hypothetical protein